MSHDQPQAMAPADDPDDAPAINGAAVDVAPRRAKGGGWKAVYDTLRDGILTLALPPGQLLDEQTLAERFGLSRSPVREALIRLAGEDLVTTLPNRSTIVAPLDLADFPRYIDALDIAQRMNTRLAAEARTEADLQAIAAAQAEFEKAARSGQRLQMSQANREFHLSIARAGRNRYLTAFYERLLDQGRRMLHLHFDYLERSTEGQLLTGEHEEMLQAIRDRDVARADALAHAHTRQFRDQFLEYLRANSGEELLMQAWPSR